MADQHFLGSQSSYNFLKIHQPWARSALMFFIFQEYFHSKQFWKLKTKLKRYESWTVKKAECRRIDAFELSCWRRLLRVPWTARRSNQSILKEISPGCSLEGLILKLKLQSLATSCEEMTYLKRPWCWDRLGAGREGDDRGWDGWMASPTRWTWVWVNSGSWWCTGRPGVLQFMGSQRVGHDWATELNWSLVQLFV